MQFSLALARRVGSLGTIMVWLALGRVPAHADLLAFFDFNDASNPDVAVDISGKGNHGEPFGATFTDGGAGRTGGAGDRAMDFADDQDGVYMTIPSALDGAFLSITDNDAATVTLWTNGGEAQPQNGFVFWFEPGRQLSATIPWSNGGVFFDVAGCCAPSQRIVRNVESEEEYRDQWNHYAFVKDGEYTAIYQNGELWHDSGVNLIDPLGDIDEVIIGAGFSGDIGMWSYNGLLDEIGIWDEALTEDAILDIMQNGLSTEVRLLAGDADQDLDFDQLDLVQVQIAAKYLTGQPAAWSEGDWDGAPGGSVGNPPAGDGQFNQLDIIAALSGGAYLTGPYGALSPAGEPGDRQTSVIYNAQSGEVAVDAPAGAELTSINIDSASAIFTGGAAQNLGGSFDNDADNNIFKATFGSSFGSLSFGNVAQAGLSEQFVLSDFTVVGSLAGGGDLGKVDLIYVPEPSTLVLLAVALVWLAGIGGWPATKGSSSWPAS